MRWVTSRLRVSARDRGFTLIEMTVSLLIISIAMLGLAGAYGASARSLSQAKAREGAASLLLRTMEQMRALPYDTIKQGLYAPDLAGDPYIMSGKFKAPYDATSVAETVVTHTNNTPTIPLYPHRRATTEEKLGGVQYTVGAYVTRADEAVTVAPFWLTVVVSYTLPNSTQARVMGDRAMLYSPEGCTSTTTRPFPGPCEAFVYGDAVLSAGSVIITAHDPTVPMVNGFDVKQLDFAFANVLSAIQYEQTAVARGFGSTSNARLIQPGTPDDIETKAGGAGTESAADNDPSSASTGSDAPPPVTQASSSVGTTGGGNPWTTNVWTNDSVSTASTVSSTASTACQALDGAVIATGNACASGVTSMSGGTAKSTLVWHGNGRPVSITPVTVDSSAGRTMTARYSSNGGTYCAAATAGNAGCVASAGTRTLTNVMLGALPTGQAGDVFPTNWDAARGILFIPSYEDKVVAEQGIGASATQIVTQTGQLSYWNGSGYSTYTYGTAPPAITIPTVSAIYDLNGGGNTLRIDVDTVVTVGAAVKVDGGTSCATPCTSKAEVVTPLAATLTYKLTFNSSAVVGHFDVSVDLGNLLAKSTYQAAPSAGP